MLTETNKLTPLIDEIRHYEDALTRLEKNEVLIRIGTPTQMDIGLSEELCEKIRKDMYSIITAEVKRLQREFKEKLKDIN